MNDEITVRPEELQTESGAGEFSVPLDALQAEAPKPAPPSNPFEAARNFLGKIHEVFQAKQAEQASQAQAAAQAQAKAEADPANWSSTRFRKDSPKPQTTQDQVMFDTVLQHKKDMEKSMVEKITGTGQEAAKLSPEQIGEQLGNHIIKSAIENPDKSLEAFQKALLGIHSIDILKSPGTDLSSTNPQTLGMQLVNSGIQEGLERPLAGLRAIAKETPIPEGFKKTFETFTKGLVDPQNYPPGTFAASLQNAGQQLRDDPKTPIWLKTLADPTVSGALGAAAEAGYYFGIPEAMGRLVTTGKVSLLKEAVGNFNKFAEAHGGESVTIPEDVYKQAVQNKDVFHVMDAYLKSKNLRMRIEAPSAADVSAAEQAGKKPPEQIVKMDVPVTKEVTAKPEEITAMPTNPAEAAKAASFDQHLEKNLQPQQQKEANFIRSNIGPFEAHYDQQVMKEYNVTTPNVVSADVAKTVLTPGREPFQAQMSVDRHEGSSAFAKMKYDELLKNPGDVLLMAGGSGAGKTTSLSDAGLKLNDYAAVYDSNMRSISSASRVIDKALASDPTRNVVIAYVDRNPITAFEEGVFQRFLGRPEHRIVPVETHIANYDSRMVIEKVIDKYKDNPRVDVRLVDNSGGKGAAQVVSLDALPPVRYNAAEIRSNLTQFLRRKFYELKSTPEGAIFNKQAFDTFLGQNTRAKGGGPGNVQARISEPRAARQTQKVIKAPASLIGHIRRSYGGINPASIRDFNLKEDFIQSGLLSVLNKKGGNFSRIAENLASEGVLHGYKEGDSESQALMDALKGKQLLKQKDYENEIAEREARLGQELYNQLTTSEKRIIDANQKSSRRSLFAKAKGQVLSDVSRRSESPRLGQPPNAGVRPVGKLPPVGKIPRSAGIKLTSGIDPGVDKFYAEDVKPALEQARAAAGIAKAFVQELGDAFVATFEPAKPVEKGLGSQAYSSVIRAFHTPDRALAEFDNTRAQTLDVNFEEAEKWFNKFSEKELRDFNLTRGEAEDPAAQALQAQAHNHLRAELKDPTVLALIKEASDYVYAMAKDNGLELRYMKDYFYGTYKNAGKVDEFLNHWMTTERFIKDKVFPTIADAAAYGLELRDQNPIRNIKSELRLVAIRTALLNLKNNVGSEPYAVETDKASDHQKLNWKAISEPLFRGLLFDPRYAKYVNGMLETNKVTQNKFVRFLRNTAYAFQQIKFFGSAFHMGNMVKASIAEQAGGVLNPQLKGIRQTIKAFQGLDKSDPQYLDYVNIGGGHRYSVESQAQELMSTAIDKIMRGNYLGGMLRLPLGAIQSKYIPGSPGFVRWMFDEYIPKLKFDSFRAQVTGKTKTLGRALTDGEKIDIIKQNQNFYGEMNERLFGRTGTMTSALRLLFQAPGYGEGNFRTAFKATKGDWRSAQFILYTILGTLFLSTLGTRLMTGKWPDPPKSKEDIRDLFKTKTTLTDGNGDPVFIDNMTYDKDYWTIFGNILTGHASKIPPELTNRIKGMVSTPAKILSDLTDLSFGKNLVDYKNDPIFFKTDSFPTKVKKFMIYEAQQAAPISFGTFKTTHEKGTSAPQAVLQSMIGYRTTSSEQVKDVKSKIQSVYDLKHAKDSAQGQLDKLYQENPSEAEKQMDAYNARVDQALKAAGVDKDNISLKIMKSLYVNNLKEKKPSKTTQHLREILTEA